MVNRLDILFTSADVSSRHCLHREDWITSGIKLQPHLDFLLSLLSCPYRLSSVSKTYLF